MKATLAQLDGMQFDDTVAVETAALLKIEQDAILDLVNRAERLAQIAQAQFFEFVVCHCLSV